MSVVKHAWKKRRGSTACKKLMLEEYEHVHERLTCIPKSLCEWRHNQYGCLSLWVHVPTRHTSSTSLLAGRPWCYGNNQHALTWSSPHDAAGSNVYHLHSGEDCGSSNQTPIFPALIPVASPLKLCSMSSTPKPALGIFCHSLKT